MVGTMIEAKRALGMFPRGLYLLTSRFEHKRAGQFVEFVQPCSHEPLMICVAARKGHSVEPLIRDSRCFAVCRVDPDDKLLHRKFDSARTPDSAGDPFDSLEVERLATGAPVLRRAMAVLDCEVSLHLDLEADHELYIGVVVGARACAASVSGVCPPGRRPGRGRSPER